MNETKDQKSGSEPVGESPDADGEVPGGDGETIDTEENHGRGELPVSGPFAVDETADDGEAPRGYAPPTRETDSASPRTPEFLDSGEEGVEGVALEAGQREADADSGDEEISEQEVEFLAEDDEGMDTPEEPKRQDGERRIAVSETDENVLVIEPEAPAEGDEVGDFPSDDLTADEEIDSEPAPAGALSDASSHDEADDEYEWSDWSDDEIEEIPAQRPELLHPILEQNSAPEVLPSRVLDAGTVTSEKAVTVGGVRARWMLVFLLLVVLGAAGVGGLMLSRHLSALQANLKVLEARLANMDQEPSVSLPAVAPSSEIEVGKVDPAPAEAAVIAADVPRAGGALPEPAPEPASEIGIVTPEFSPDGAAASGDFKRLVDRVEFLERRGKLTRLADEAISSGSRYAYNQLEDAYRNPGMIGIKVAANSEIIRVESIYARTAGLRYRGIPVDIIDPTLKNDLELSVPQLGDLIVSSSVAAEVRARAAQLLGERRSVEVLDILAESLRTEPNLAVMVEAGRSFKRVSGFKEGRIFPSKDLQDWYTENRERLRREFAAAAFQSP